MNREQKVIRAKVGLLELAKQLGNVSQACKMMGYSRDRVSCFRELYDMGGAVALQELSRRKPLLANRTAPEVEALIVEIALEQPAYGQIRVANAARPRACDLASGRARRLAAPRPGDDEEAAEGAGSQGRPGGPGAHRRPARGAGEGQGREGDARRVRASARATAARRTPSTSAR
jgi:hypothetical protein